MYLSHILTKRYRQIFDPIFFQADYKFDLKNNTLTSPTQSMYTCEGPFSEWIISKDNNANEDSLASYIVVLRIFRVARIAKLSRRSHKLTLMAKTITSSLKELSLLFLFICFATILYSTLIYWICGNQSSLFIITLSRPTISAFLKSSKLNSSSK